MLYLAFVADNPAKSLTLLQDAKIARCELECKKVFLGALGVFAIGMLFFEFVDVYLSVRSLCVKDFPFLPE